MSARLSLRLLTIIGAIGLAATPAAAAATASVQESVSSNWSGYVVRGAGTSSRYSKVSASWVQPSIKPGSGDSYSVFWVGLGGSDGTSDALEQVGTEASYVGGKIEYYAWYELVPAGPVKLSLRIKPGDRIYAQVSASGTSVTVAIADQATGKWVKRTLHTSHLDTTSAEWIAEAPSSCGSSDNCKPLALADFGTVKFNDATATADGHTGSIADPAWTVQAVRLNATVDEGAAAGPGFVSYQLSAGGAEPSSLDPDGSSFSVWWSGLSGAYSSSSL